MEKKVRQALLFDFYGELLTDRQKQIFEEAVMDDLSYAEIAEDHRISRQAAYDIVHRSTMVLERYEERLGLLDRFLQMRRQVESIRTQVQELDTDPQLPTSVRERIHRIADLCEEVAGAL